MEKERKRNSREFDMTVEEYLEEMEPEYLVTAGSEAHLVMHEMSREALRITMDINNKYHTHEEIIKLMSELTGSEIDDSFGMFPPFYTDCGRNIHVGKNVFINAGCKFQDQGGIYIDDGTLIGHNAVLATINHSEDPRHRGDMIFQPIHIGKNVWLGANVTVLPGVTIGDGAVIAAGAVVTKNVPENTMVAGVPARFIKKIKLEGEENIEMRLFINDIEIPVIWEDNITVSEIKEQLVSEEITIPMSMYSDNEQVGPLGRSYTSNDQQTTTHSGDIVLYNSDQIVVFYGSNFWAYTRLGRMDIPGSDVTKLLSEGDVTLRITK